MVGLSIDTLDSNLKIQGCSFSNSLENVEHKGKMSDNYVQFKSSLIPWSQNQNNETNNSEYINKIDSDVL